MFRRALKELTSALIPCAESAGIIYADSRRPVEAAALRQMAAAIAHRGPDAEGLWRGPGVGLAHRRLSIIDLAGGDQPMGNEDGSIQVVFNGEIYNYRDLKTELGTEGASLPDQFRHRSARALVRGSWRRIGPSPARHVCLRTVGRAAASDSCWRAIAWGSSRCTTIAITKSCCLAPRSRRSWPARASIARSTPKPSKTI